MRCVMAFEKRARFSVRSFTTQGLASRAFSTMLILTTLFHMGWSVARHPGDVNVPAELRNATVRILSSGGSGSGTVINIRRDAQGHGGWLCVLTADHVVGPYNGWQIGFGNIADGWQYNAQVMIRGPQNAGGTRVDLAMLGVRVDNLRTLPNLLLPVPDVPFANMNDVVIAGYGDTGRINPNRPNAYELVQDYGTYRNGAERIERDNIPHAWNDRDANNQLITAYEFRALEYKLSFAPAGQWPPNSGDAYFLSGDSGGPSTMWRDLNNNGQVDAGEVRLVGVHSTSQTAVDLNGNNREDNGEPYNAGFFSHDVRVGSYLNWVNQSCAAVPEPASMTALGIGLLALLTRRRRSKA